MSDGKRYKNDNDEIKNIDREEAELQRQYKALLEEINAKNKEDEALEIQEKEFLEKEESLVIETIKEGDNIVEDDSKSDLYVPERKVKERTIQEIKENIKESTEQILEKIENESGIERETEKLNEIKDKIKELEKGVLNKEDETLFFEVEEDKPKIKNIDEIEKEVLFSMDDEEIISEDKMEKKTNKKKEDIIKPKKKRVLKIIGNIIYYIAFLFILAILALVLIQRFSNNEISLGGYRMFNILTGSMEPDYEVGDVLISKYIEPKDIELGDDVVYKGKEKPFEDIIVTHRVVDLNEEEDGTYRFITRGTANDVDDPIIDESQIYGKIIYKMKSFSLLSKAINNMYVFFFVIFIPVAVLLSIKILQVRSEKTGDYED